MHPSLVWMSVRHRARAAGGRHDGTIPWSPNAQTGEARRVVIPAESGTTLTPPAREATPIHARFYALLMDARPSPDGDYASGPSEVATAYRVTLWEQPARPSDIDRPRMGWSPYPGAPMGWEGMTFDLVGAQDVREAIQWADATLASNEGPASRRGCPVHDQEYVIYAKVPNEDLWLQVAGRNPVLGA